jgi:hypothetical protein
MKARKYGPLNSLIIVYGLLSTSNLFAGIAPVDHKSLERSQPRKIVFLGAYEETKCES